MTSFSVFHYFRLVYRSILFLLLLIAYIIFRIRGGTDLMTRADERPVIISVLSWYLRWK